MAWRHVRTWALAPIAIFASSSWRECSAGPARGTGVKSTPLTVGTAGTLATFTQGIKHYSSQVKIVGSLQKKWSEEMS